MESDVAPARGAGGRSSDCPGHRLLRAMSMRNEITMSITGEIWPCHSARCTGLTVTSDDPCWEGPQVPADWSSPGGSRAAGPYSGSIADRPVRAAGAPADDHQPVVNSREVSVMPRTEPFEIHHRRYEAWFEQHAAAYASELLALRPFVPLEGRGRGLEIGVGTGRFAAPLGVSAWIPHRRGWRAPPHGASRRSKARPRRCPSPPAASTTLSW